MARIALVYYADIWYWVSCHLSSMDRSLLLIRKVEGSIFLVSIITCISGCISGLILLSRQTNNFWKNYHQKFLESNVRVHRVSIVGPSDSSAWRNNNLAIWYCNNVRLVYDQTMIYIWILMGFLPRQYFLGWLVPRDVGTGGQCGVIPFSFRN